MDSKTTSAIDEIWLGDLLGRKQEAQHLLRFLENKYQAETNVPFVLNIDSSWGHGKTFFISRFAEQLRHHNFPVVLFDAWKNDFSDEALLSFISAVCTALDTELNGANAKQEVKKLKDYASSLIKPALPILLSALVKQLTGMSAPQLLAQSKDDTSDNEPVDDVAELGAKLSQLAASKALEVYTEKKHASEGFTKTIKNLVSIVVKGRSKKELPIFIFVDELDRCRPTFSIELLEGIKHLFSAPGVYFIVSTDTKQLCHSIKAVYGAEFDASRYLKRFFDMEYQLEPPKTHQLAAYLFENFTFKDKLYLPERIHSEHSIEECFGDICDFFKFGARDVEQVFEVIKTSTYLVENELHFVYLMLIACMQHKYPEHPIFFNQNINKTELDDFFSQKISLGELEETTSNYDDNDAQGRLASISLINIFNTYLHISRSDLLSPSYQKKLTAVGRNITLKLIKDNNYVPRHFSDDTPKYDKTLSIYVGLVRRAGKFQ